MGGRELEPLRGDGPPLEEADFGGEWREGLAEMRPDSKLRAMLVAERSDISGASVNICAEAKRAELKIQLLAPKLGI